MNSRGNPVGMEKMDSIYMLLIVIGESLKNLDKITEEQLRKKVLMTFYEVIKIP